MKYIFIVSMIIVTFSCSKSDDCLSFEKTITINFGETKSICDNLEISFISVVNESRCPDNVQCVWAGELEVELSLIEELDQVSLLTLKLAGLEEESESVEFNNVRYKLMKGDPCPSIGNAEINEEDYILVITVESL